MRLSRPAAIALMVLPLMGRSAAADPIEIVAGTLTFQRGSDILISLTGGIDGFTYAAHVYPGIIGTSLPMLGEPVQPGSLLNLRTPIGGSEAGGTATFRGETYTLIGSNSPTSAHIGMEWSGSLLLPAGFTGGTLTTPFSFSGSFAIPGPPNNTLMRVFLAGDGLASLTFGTHTALPDHFMLSAALFDFAAQSTDPVPEPASMLLAAGGLSVIVAARRRRRRPTQTV